MYPIAHTCRALMWRNGLRGILYLSRFSISVSLYPPGRFYEEGFVSQWKALALAIEALSWMEF
jgi:hypothetical protein